jgi:hypothetical protein
VKKFELRRQQHQQQQQQQQANTNNTDQLTSSVSSSVLASPKSGLSLGARIQSKAKENNPESAELNTTPPGRRSSEIIPSSSTTPTPTTTTPTYTNRTLYLRQQSAKAKRDSLERRAENQNGSQSTRSNQPNKSTGNAHKSVSSSSRTPMAAAQRSSSKATCNSSRTNSRTSSPLSNYGNHQNLMSTSMVVQNNVNKMHQQRPGQSSRLLLPTSKATSNDRLSDLADSYESADNGKEVIFVFQSYVNFVFVIHRRVSFCVFTHSSICPFCFVI